ncbi:MAG: transporter substrate-binding protein [Pseudonocardia sp.]|nr:transporter substrate-binding protein [Pseudonocardia sp.]
MKRSRAAWSAVAMIAASALVLSACSSGGGSNTSSGSASGEEKVALDTPYNRPQVPDIGAVVVTVDEAAHNYNNNTGANNSLASVYVDTLLQPSPYFVDANTTLRIDKDYMDSITVKSQSPFVLEYKWRPEAVWSDGQPVGCKDMYLLWLAANATAKNGAAQIFDSSPNGYDQISKLDCSPDGKTVTANFSKPYADYRGLFTTVGQSGSQLVPAHLLEAKTGIADITKLDPKTDSPDLRKAADFFTTKWNGYDPAVALSAGPYKVESWTDNASTVLVRNDKWWGAPGGPSKLTITGVTDSQANVQKLFNKEAQVIAPQADSAISEQIRAQGGAFTSFAQQGQTYEHIDLQMSKPLFKDNPEFRKAIAACVNRDDIVNKLIKSVDDKAKPLGAFLYLPTESEYQDFYGDTGKGNVADAKKLMEAGGWALGADGVYAKNGVRASFKLGHKLVDRRTQTAQLVAGSCKPAGIEVIDDPSQDFNSKRLPAGDFDAALFAWVGSPIKSSNVPNYLTKAKGGTANYNSYSNPQVDDLLLASTTELDQAKRAQDFHDADKLMAADLHSIPLFQLPDFAASDSSITPVSYLGFSGGALWNAFAWRKK